MILIIKFNQETSDDSLPYLQSSFVISEIKFGNKKIIIKNSTWNMLSSLFMSLLAEPLGLEVSPLFCFFAGLSGALAFFLLAFGENEDTHLRTKNYFSFQWQRLHSF